MRDINWLRQQAQAQSLGGPQNASPVRTKPNPTTPSPSRAGAATNAGVVGTPAAPSPVAGGQNAPVTHMTMPTPAPTNQSPVNPGLINDFTVTPTPAHNDGPGPGYTPTPPNNLTFRDKGYARFDSGHGMIGGGHDGHATGNGQMIHPGYFGRGNDVAPPGRERFLPSWAPRIPDLIRGNQGHRRPSGLLSTGQGGNWSSIRDALMGSLSDIYG